MSHEVILKLNNGQSAPIIGVKKMKIVTKEMVEERIRNRFPNEPFEIIEYTKISKPIIIKCLDCQRITKYSTCNNFLGAKKS